MLQYTRTRRTGDGVGAREFRFKRSCVEKHFSLRRRRCGSGPRGNVLVERRSGIKHICHISHLRCVPTPNVLVERRSGSKHKSHSNHFLCVPTPNVLVERRSGIKHSIHIRHFFGNKQASKKISVTIPKGVDDGTRIRLAGKGEAGLKGGANGDLYLFINVHSHDLFKRSDENLFFEFPISIADAALGTTIEIPTIDGGKAKIKIPDGTQNGKQFRLKGKGMPYMRGSGNGDLYVQVNTEVPISLNKEQKDLLEKFREIENEKSNPSIKQFFQKAKSFWKN